MSAYLAIFHGIILGWKEQQGGSGQFAVELIL
jgi:hypothetical protein